MHQVKCYSKTFRNDFGAPKAHLVVDIITVMNNPYKMAIFPYHIIMQIFTTILTHKLYGCNHNTYGAQPYNSMEVHAAGTHAQRWGWQQTQQL